MNGFALRVSKYDQKPYLLPPSKSMGMGKGFYKFVLMENSLWKEIEKEALRQYEYDMMPIIEEK
ncbi:MAG: hypothetical protein IIC67_11470 [Thaumarchaeota archaeon]|nr:hypothetical protein [Nitrososphaerota archaeon]